MLILELILATVAGTALLYALLPDSRKEWSLLPILFMGVLFYLGITAGIALGTWVMISAFVGSGVGPGIVIGSIWLITTIAVARMWLNG